MYIVGMEYIESKIQEDLDDFRNIPNLKKELVKDRLYLLSKNKDHPLIREIDTTLYNEGVLCNELYQIHMSEKEMEQYILRKNWRPLLDDTNIGCGLNVLSFLDIIPKKFARGKITCLNVDAGFPMSEIKDLIMKHKRIKYNMQVNKITFNIENLQKFIFNQLNDENLTIIRTYVSNTSKIGHTMILYKSSTKKLYVFDPQQEVYAELTYEQNAFVIRPFLFMTASNNNYKHMQEYLNKCISFEFLTTNEKLQTVPSIRKTPAFEPLYLTEDTPFHMFLLIAHGSSVYPDKHKDFLEFPFHSLGFFVEKGLILIGATPEMSIEYILGDVSAAMKGSIEHIYIDVTDPLGNKILGSRAKTSDVIVNTTGKIEVYPMHWTVNPADITDMKNVMGLYHLIYDKTNGKFQKVNKIFGYDFFIDRTTQKPRQLYYGHIIRKCNQYYNDNKTTYFKNIPRQLIFMGIWSCRTTDPRYLSPAKKDGNTEERMEIVEEEMNNSNVSKLKQYLQNITKAGGKTEGRPDRSPEEKPTVGKLVEKPEEKPTVGKLVEKPEEKPTDKTPKEPEFLEMVSEDELFQILSQQQQLQESIQSLESTKLVPRESRRRRGTRINRKSRRNRKTRKSPKQKIFSIL